MNNLQDQDQKYQQTAAPENIFTNIYNVIAGARQSASQEFTRFWEGLGHSQKSYGSPSRKILVPTPVRNRQYSMNARFLPDDNVRGIVNNTENLVDEALSIPNKRSASVTEEYHIPFPVKRLSLNRDSSFEVPASISRRIEEPEPQQDEQQEEKEISIPYENPAVIKEPLPPPPAKIVKASSVSPMRLTSVSKAAGRFSPSPNRDVLTGSKSVRRLTLELEEQFTPRFPSPFSPKKQSSSDASPPSSLYRDQAESSSPQYQSSPLSSVNKSSPPTLKTFNFNIASPNKSQPTHATNEREDDDHSANLLRQQELDERIHKLEEKVSIARSKVTEYSSDGITSPTPSHTILASENEFSSPKRIDSSPKAANTVTPTNLESLNRPKPKTSPLRNTTVDRESKSPFSNTSATASVPFSYAYNHIKSPIRDTIATSSSSPIYKKAITSPYRSSITTSPQKKESSSSPSSISYATARAAIQQSVGKNSPFNSPSTFGEKGSSVRSTIVPSKTGSWSLSPPRAPPPPPHTTKITSSTYSAPKNTPSPYLQKEETKPNDSHKSQMKELIQMIPTVKLRKTDILIGPDGVKRPNPFWNEIYNNRRRF